MLVQQEMFDVRLVKECEPEQHNGSQTECESGNGVGY
jgi:hypothetical protein